MPESLFENFCMEMGWDIIMSGSENPWNQVSLETYEAHMSQVAQLQALNHIMKSQFAACPEGSRAAVLGVAGGNGLEHAGKMGLVYGVDLNEEYLKACSQRYRPVLGLRLQLLRLDLNAPNAELPEVDLLLANLLVEYIGVEAFCEKAVQAKPQIISCVIQLPDYNSGFVSESPYQEAFQAIGKLHQDVDELMLTAALAKFGYRVKLRDITQLPNGKELLRLDYEKEASWIKGPCWGGRKRKGELY